VVVAGYYPWSQLHSLPKSTQMKALCDWLSGGAVPVLSESYAKVVLWSRGGAVVILNASLDPVPELRLRLSSDRSQFTHTAMDGGRREIAGETASRGLVRVRLMNLAPWSVHLLA
jgi:hypothetical protein